LAVCLFDDFSELGQDQSFPMLQSVGDALTAYLPIVNAQKRGLHRARAKLSVVASRYVEFNLVWDRGTHFRLRIGWSHQSICCVPRRPAGRTEVCPRQVVRRLPCTAGLGATDSGLNAAPPQPLAPRIGVFGGGGSARAPPWRWRMRPCGGWGWTFLGGADWPGLAQGAPTERRAAPPGHVPVGVCAVPTHGWTTAKSAAPAQPAQQTPWRGVQAEHPGASLLLLMGQDQAPGLAAGAASAPRWCAPLICVASRRGHPTCRNRQTPSPRSPLAQHRRPIGWGLRIPGAIQPYTMPAMDLSATDVRRQAGRCAGTCNLGL